jgi:hypothetical protein
MAFLLFALAAICAIVALYKGFRAIEREHNAALAEMTAQRDYWRTRAERLTDAALVRAGAIHQPTMETPPPRDRVQAAASMLTAALSVTEISGKPKDS